MDCAEEVSLLRRDLGARTGIRELSFDVIQGRMDVAFEDTQITSRQLTGAVQRLGMRCEPWKDSLEDTGPWWRNHWRSVLAAVSGVSLISALVWQGMTTGEWVSSLLAHQHSDESGHLNLSIGVRLLLLVAIAAGSANSWGKALGSLRALRPDMNALVLFSVLGALVLGEWAEAATLSFLYSLAGLLETWSLGRARDAVTHLLRLSPRVATVLHRHGGHDHEHRVPADSLAPGATVRVRPGERIPCDGTVARGMSAVDQALLTGESVPIEKGPGDSVFAGTMNTDGPLDIEVTRAFSDSLLARMTRMIGDSQKRRAPSEQFVEKFTRYYTPAVFALSLAVMVVPPLLGGNLGDWFYQGMVVLLISCPCALVISTPVSIAAALTAAARHGVLVKGGAYLEELARVKVVAFDKTGVLTQGGPEVQRLVPLGGVPAAEILECLASLESGSEHPLAHAILRFAKKEGVARIAAAELRTVPGMGAEAEMAQGRFWVGSPRLVRERGLWAGEVAQAAESMTDQDHTIVVCGMNDTPWAVLSIVDPPRRQARTTVRALQDLGVRRQVMLTGDNLRTARSVAEAVGITDYRAELLPAEKAEAVASLQREYGSVAMVGDGVNDALALGAANVGINFGSQQVDVAAETADVVLLDENLSRLEYLREHAARTLRIIQQNLILALGLKGVFLILAVMGKATLWMAVAADMGATFLVTFNGLRLLASRPAKPASAGLPSVPPVSIRSTPPAK